MAICEDVPGIEVVVVVDGQVAEEWDPPNNYDDVQVVEQPPRPLDTDKNKPHGYVVKYIESKTGAPFEFVVNKTSRFKRYGHHFAYAAQVDGEQVELDHEHDQEGKKGKVDTGPWQGVTKGYWTGSFDDPDNMLDHLFKFADVTLVEESNLSEEETAREESKARNCGIHRVLLWHMRQSWRMKRSEVPVSDEIPSITSLNAKTLGARGITHCTGYTTTKCQDLSRVSKQPYWANHNDPLWDAHTYARPFAIFEFRYRSREALVDQGVVPPPEVVERVQSMSEPQRKRLLMRYMEAEQRQAKRQRTMSQSEERGHSRVKPERRSPAEERPVRQNAVASSSRAAMSLTSRPRQRN